MPKRDLTEDEKKIVAETVAIGLEMQHRFRPEPLYKLTGKGYMESEGVTEMARLKEEAAFKAGWASCDSVGNRR